MQDRSCHPPAVEPSAPEPARPASPGARTASPGSVSATAATLPHGAPGGAVVLFGVIEAVVARTRPDGRDEIVRIRRRTRAAGAPPFLLRVIRELGERAPIVVLSPGDEQTAFERALVAISHRPDHIFEDSSVHDAHPAALLERLRALRAHPA